MPGKFGTYSFIWNRYLKIKLSQNAGNYSSTCYPLWEINYSDKERVFSEVFFESDKLPWVYLRCSVDIQNQKFFNIHEKSFTQEQNLNSPTIIDILSGTPTPTASLKFVNESKNRGILFFRLLKLYSCYDCQSVDNYKINWMNSDIIKSQTVNNNLLYHVDGRIQDFDSIKRSSDTDELSQKLPYIKGSTGTEFSSNLTPLSTTEFLGYNVLDMSNTKYATLSTANSLCSENTEFCTGLVKLNQVSDVTIAGVTPSFSGKYTIEFWMRIKDFTKLSNGFHVIWKGLGAVSFIYNTNKLFMTCLPQEFRISNPNLDTLFGAELITNFLTISNKAQKEKSTNAQVEDKWLFVRCATDNIDRKAYGLWEDDINDSAAEKAMDEVSPSVPSFLSPQTTSVILAGMSRNTECDIYLRNLYLYSDYLLQDYTTKKM